MRNLIEFFIFSFLQVLLFVTDSEPPRFYNEFKLNHYHRCPIGYPQALSLLYQSILHSASW